MYNDYAKIISEAMYKKKQGREIKMLTHKQMLQRLSIAPAEIKGSKNSENLLNEMRQIVYSLYQSKKKKKKILKKYTIT